MPRRLVWVSPHLERAVLLLLVASVLSAGCADDSVSQFCAPGQHFFGDQCVSDEVERTGTHPYDEVDWDRWLGAAPMEGFGGVVVYI